MNKRELQEYISYYQPYSNNAKWAKRYLEIAPLKASRTIKLLRKYKNKDAKVLDCGSGIGLSLYYLSKFYKNIIGIDVDQQNIRIAKKQFNKLGCNTKIILYDGKKLPYRDNTFDLIISMEVWEHVKNPDIMLSEIRRVLKPGGILHITTANKLWPIEPHYHLPFLSYLPYWIADRYVKILKRGPYYHDIHLPTYTEFKNNIEKNFIVKDVTFEALMNYKKYGLDKERGKKIIAVGEFLNLLNRLKYFPFSIIRNSVFLILSYFSLGWLFIAYPKK